MAEKGKLVWSIAVDTKDLNKGLKVAKKDVDKWSKDTSKKDVKLNVKADTASLKDVSSKVGKLNGTKINIDTKVNMGQLKDADGKIAKLNGRKADVDVNVDTSEIAAAESRIARLSANSKLSSSMGGGFGAIIGGPALGALAAGGIGYGLVKGASDLDTNIRKIGTVYGDFADKDLKNVRSQVIKTSKQIGISTDELSQAIYDALSSGIPKENVFDFVKTASKTAIAGSTDLASVTRVLTGTVNAYAGMNLKAADASDILTKAVNIGVFEMSDLVQQMADITPIASAMRVPLSDATGWLAKLTKNGTPVAQAATQIKQAMAELSDSTSKAGKNFKAVSGKTFPAFIKAGGNIEGAMKLMEKQAKKLGLQNSEMFGSIEAGQAVMGVTGDNMKDFTDVLDGMRDSAGATTTAFGIMDEGISRKLSKTWQLLKEKLNDLLSAITPGILKATEIATGLLEVLFTGKFDKKLFGGSLEKDSGLIKFLQGVHDKAVEAGQAVKQLITGEMTPGDLGSKNPSKAGKSSSAARADTWREVKPPPSETQKKLEELRDVLEDITGAIVSMGKRVGETVEWFRDLISPIIDFIVQIAKPAFDSIKDSLGSLGIKSEYLKNALKVLLVIGLIPILVAAAGIIGMMYALAAALWVVRAAANIVKAVFGALGAVLSWVWELLQGIWKFLTDIPKKIKGAFGSLKDMLGKSFGNAFKDVAFKAAGGPVKKGNPYIVGELGPELYVPEGNGKIITASKTASMLSSSGGGSVSGGGQAVNLTVDVSGVTAMTRPQAKEFGSFIIDAVNDDLRKRKVEVIGAGYVKSAS